ncbi:phytanoyl-CoA dioxygenase family protein [Phenylobacterium sp.]|uniref:phytanoyl-CoA dioxygenase family protein n=1 Tax=Phenylobacterium sp. TaxID=1871053 RepID=UPI00301D728F
MSRPLNARPAFGITPERIAQFERDGVLRLDGLISEDWARRAREAVLRPLSALGLRVDGAWRLEGRPRPVWPATGLKPARDIGHRHPEVEALLDEPGVAAWTDALLEGRGHDRTVYRRPQILASLPNGDTWSPPQGWHTDLPRLTGGIRPGVQIFTFLEPVAPRGGGTLVVAGSHRVLSGEALRPRDVARRLRAAPFFRDLYAGRPYGDALPAGETEGVPLKVVELTGRPGDAWIIDLRLLHAAAPNASDTPRLMVTHRFLRADLLPEVAAALGWAV